MFITMKKEILIKFGNKVREKRLELGLSQEELATRAKVHRTYIGMIERAEKKYNFRKYRKNCKGIKNCS